MARFADTIPSETIPPARKAARMFIDATADPAFRSWILVLPNPNGFGDIVLKIDRS